MVLAVNKRYSLHKNEPDTYSHCVYVFVDHFEKRWWLIGGAPSTESIDKLARSIRNGASLESDLYPRQFVSANENWRSGCINEYATAMSELPNTPAKGE